MTASKLLSVARSQLGITESPAGSNRVKYNEEYYGRPVSGRSYPWCVVFQWWCFRAAGASRLFYGGGQTASCTALYSYHKKRSQDVTDYRPGDLVFFNFSGGTATEHVGLCESYDGVYITTIDGNTGTGNEANGGAVMRRRRHKRYIVGAYRPAYQKETAMTTEEAKSTLKAKAGLSDTTIEYLWSYRWGDELLVKLAEAMEGK